MKVIWELFSGSQSVGNVARAMGFAVRSLDILDVEGLKTEWITDYMNFDVTRHALPDFIWASPDCAAFSLAAGAIHFAARSITPLTEKAKQSILVVEKLMSDIRYLLTKNPKLIFWIENPVGKMAWLECMQTGHFQKIENFRKVRLDQCAYGRKFRKATHIFTNDPKLTGWLCVGGGCHHSKGDGMQDSGWGKISPNLKNIGGSIKKPKSAWKQFGEHRGNQPKVSLLSGYWLRAQLPKLLIETILNPYQ